MTTAPVTVPVSLPTQFFLLYTLSNVTVWGRSLLTVSNASASSIENQVRNLSFNTYLTFKDYNLDCANFVCAKHHVQWQLYTVERNRASPNVKRRILIDVLARFSFSNVSPPNVELSVTLNISLATNQRFILINDLFLNNVTLNSSYALTVRIAPDPVTVVLRKFWI